MRNSSHTLVEIDLENPSIGRLMADMFGIDESCWGINNVNIGIHPELNRSNVGVSRQVLPRKNIYEDSTGSDDPAKEADTGELERKM